MTGKEPDIGNRRDPRLRREPAKPEPGRPELSSARGDRAPGKNDLGSDADDEDAVLAKVREVMSRIKYGTVVLTIHDGKIVQVELAEKIRL